MTTTDSVLSWAVPDMRFSPEQIAAAEGVVAGRLGGPERVRLAVLGGSFAVGLGHGTSDVDLYVVGEGLPDSEVVIEYGPVPVHVNPVPAERVRALLELACEYRVTGADRAQIGMEVKALNALIRIVTGVPLHVGPEWREPFGAFSFDVVRQINLVRNGNISSAMAEDAYGALKCGDLLTAATASALALEYACEAVLAAAGDVYFGPKFHYRRLARTATTAPWLDHVWRLNHRVLHPDSGADEQTVRAVTEQRLWAAGTLMAHGVVEGWDKPLAELPEPSVPQGDGARRSAYFTPLRFTDGWALVGPDEGYRVSEAVVRLWRALDGRPLSRLAPQDVPADITDVEAAVASLAAYGAVRGSAAAGTPDPQIIRPEPEFSCHPKVAAP
ncbi:hypothetical protein C1708_00030 [Streptomyces sp. DH-12]|uniref:nucleotidyltransferase domain-containing protein n=1 Tax=unclassified Streptomyces TaxID=2593676 RepID=UPI000CCFC411|nr:nucleotidyltransferase domain-containing protein [Streptomyces sp. DH-12]PNV30954.1 hypothetical protein C1708_00030 [Streptomyces sp. DH-12]